MYTPFKRNNENVEAVKNALQTIDEETRKHVEELIKDYEKATYAEWNDRNEFNAEAIDTMINDFGFDEKMIAEKMATNHPTLQQSFMRLCMRFIEKMAQKPYYDGRNEASVKTAQKIIEALGGETYLPMV